MVIMIPTNTAYETNIRLPLLFIVFGVISFAASQTIALLAGPAMVNGMFRLPTIWAAAHLAVLGFALMIAMGAMYQLVPVAFLTPIWSEQLGFLQFFILKQMMNEKWTVVQCVLFIISAIGVTAALTVSSLPLFYVAQGAMTLFSLLFAGTVVSVLRK
jgi:hypothetical protein